jgi:acyl-CoA synthetase (AMP-forming)/AMP-acid ligase II
VTQSFRFDAEFEQQAARTPQDVALRFHDDAVTYAELDARANRVANYLRDTGVAAGAYVGLHVERSIDAVAAVLGILKASGAVVPLPPSWPAERVAEILRFANLDAVIDAASLAAALRADTATPPRIGRDDRPAFVICSSGSTGTPKMIVRSHGSFLHRLQWTWEQHPFTACRLRAVRTAVRGVAHHPRRGPRSGDFGVSAAECHATSSSSLLQASLDIPASSRAVAGPWSDGRARSTTRVPRGGRVPRRRRSSLSMEQRKTRR